MTLNTEARLAMNRLILGWKGGLEVIRPSPLLKADSTVKLEPTSRLLQLSSVTQRALVMDNSRNEPFALASVWKVRKRAAVLSLMLNLEQRSGVQIWADSCHITRKDGICCRKSRYANMQGNEANKSYRLTLLTRLQMKSSETISLGFKWCWGGKSTSCLQ